MFNFDQTNPSYILLSIFLIFSGVLIILPFGVGSLTLTIGLLAGILMLYDTWSAKQAGVKNLKRGVPMLGLWLTLMTALSLISFLPTILGTILPFLGVAAGGLLLAEESRNNSKGMLLTTGWVLASSIISVMSFFGIAFPGIVGILLAVLGIAAGYFLIQDK